MMEKSQLQESFARLMHRKPVIVSLCWLLMMVIIAILAPIIANERPLYFSYGGSSYFPALSGDDETIITDSRTRKQVTVSFINTEKSIARDSKKIYPPVRYAPNKSDLDNSDYVGPFDEQHRSGTDANYTILSGTERHMLGTGRRGEDVLSGLIHGTRVSMTVGFFSMAIAGIIGIFAGAMAGYFGDDKLKISRGSMITTLLGILPAWFYGFQLRSFEIEAALRFSSPMFLLEMTISVFIFVLTLFLFNRSGKLLNFIPYLARKSNLPVDNMVSRCIEVFISLPRLILIISIAAIARPSLLNLILIIGLTSWTEIARFTRAEMLRIRNLDYIQSARALGYPALRIIFIHALPNAIAPALITITFGIAGAILIESSLSFLGIGVPPEVVTWGSLLASGKDHFPAWWLVVFPGLAIFFTVTAFNLLGEGLRDAFDPKLKK